MITLQWRCRSAWSERVMPLRHETSRRLLLLIATVLAVIVGFLFEHAIHGLFGSPVGAAAAFAAVLAGITAFLSTAFLMRYVRRHDDWALNPFAYYCLAAGLGSLVC